MEVLKAMRDLILMPKHVNPSHTNITINKSNKPFHLATYARRSPIQVHITSTATILTSANLLGDPRDADNIIENLRVGASKYSMIPVHLINC